MRTLLELNSYEPYLLEFLRALCTCKIVLLLIKPIGFLKFLLPHRRPPYCLPTHPRKKLTLHTLDFISLCVLTERIRETSMEPKFSSLKLSADIPPKTFFGKLSTPENIVTGDEGKKSSDKKKSYNRKLTKNLNSDIENEKIQTFKYKKKNGKSSKIYSLLGPVIKFSDDMILFLFEGKTQEFNVDTTLN